MRLFSILCVNPNNTPAPLVGAMPYRGQAMTKRPMNTPRAETQEQRDRRLEQHREEWSKRGYIPVPIERTESHANTKAVYETHTWLDVAAVACAGAAGVYIVARLAWVGICIAIGQ